jgi:thiamine-phosphate pyrophosphorylase
MSGAQHKLRGLYVITDYELARQRNIPLLVLITQAIHGGARIVQYRNKHAAFPQRCQEAAQLVHICKTHNVTFLINDDVETALEVDADGVHLGQSDTPLALARAQLGPDKIIGITCHNQLDLAQRAQQAGADYVAFGRFFASQSKPTAPSAELTILTQARQELALPICAIGGITHNNAAQVIAQGADMLAVIHAVLAAEDVADAARKFAQLFAKD